MAIPVIVQVAISGTTVSTGEGLETEMMGRPGVEGELSQISWRHLSSHLAVYLQDGPAVPTGLVGEPNLWPLQL